MAATKSLDQRLDDLVTLDPYELDEMIAKTEAKLRLLVALRGCENTVCPLPKKPVVAKPAPKPATAQPPAAIGDLAERVGAFLKLNGPKRRDSICNQIGCTNEQLDKLLEHPWFEKDAGQFALTTTGWQDLGQQEDAD